MRFLLIMLLLVWMVSPVYSYEATTQDEELMQAVEEKLNQYAANNDMLRRNFLKQLLTLEETYSSNERLKYLLWSLAATMHQPLLDKKARQENEVQAMSTTFFDEYSSQMNGLVSLPDACFALYDYVDTLSRLYDHPTSLLQAVWYRESDCRQSGTNNWWWPFQIISKDYGTNDLSLGEFFGAVEDYLAFSKEKHDRYANANRSEGLVVELWYDNRSMSGVIYHSALYNWLWWWNIWWEIRPAAPSYVYDNFGDNFSWASRNGIVTSMLRAISTQ